jgi:hypothetical protein
MPHSSSGFGEIRVNRTYLVEQETAKEDREGKFSLTGQESSPPTTVTMVAFLHEQITSLQKGVVFPVTFRDKAESDGYYTVAQATSELTDHQSEVSKADWTIDLDKCGTHTEIDLQSRLTGAVRENDHSQTGERWHAPPIGHYSYFTGATDVTSWVDRTSADGTVRVYRSIPENVHPRWGCTPTNYYGGRVRLTDTLYVSSENEIEGCCHKLSTTGWAVSNGLVNVTATASAGVIDVQSYSGGAYRSNLIKIQRNSVNVEAWQSVSIIRNTFEQVIIRLTANIVNAPGRVTLDLNLRRGSRFVEGYLQSSSSTTLKIAHASTTATSSGTGYIVKTSNDSNGNRPIIGSSKTTTADNVNGAISKASVTALDFYVGAVISATSPASGDAAADLQNQYIGTLPESTYYVKR